MKIDKNGGGNIATNAEATLASIQAVTRQYVLGLAVVRAMATRLRTGGRITNTTTGRYHRHVCRSEGCSASSTKPRCGCFVRRRSAPLSASFRTFRQAPRL